MSARVDRLVERGGKWFVYSASGDKELGGPYESRERAAERLRQIEYFKHRRDAQERRERVARRIQLLKHLSRVDPRRRAPRQRFPFALEIEYAKLLTGYVDQLRDRMGALMGALPRLTNSVASRRDAHESDRVHAMIEEIRARVLSREQLSLVVAAYARRVAEHQRKEFARQVRARLGVDVALLGVDVQVAGAKLADFVAENVSLIRSLAATPLDEVERLIARGFASGARHEDLSKEIDGRFDVARSRARLIARDQIGKLNAQMSRDANRQLGLDRWRWRSMRDGAVRPEHAALDRESEIAPFSYSGRRPRYMPGEEVQCRCYDEPVFDDVLDELKRLENE